ncbi:Undecaprenyl-diphosphatase UppP [Syntrophomonas zehnderi OL-4]|uniref:Undecaprenyl-diphosphatase n=1 Tax=Syntrophomonas zehnderi OL-4 TaxID=690567 RepID=A0A0E4GB89_9FIRM|nr:undecaprenyl-diphosphatase UppP [Syntrophomonas zehnderi]CFX83830.1 Undecaprenyl-diphosphatase UppP [Syntrophomonas zehnderi OL-4]
MSLLEAVVLGLVQGLGEFLPISSSAHLVLVPWIFNWNDPGLTFDIALHIGTLFAVIIYFWRDWLKLISAGLKGVSTQDGRLFWYLVIASIPGAIIGFLLEDIAETVFRAPLLIAIMLILMGIFLVWADRRGRKEIDLEGINLKTSFLIGLSQALAIIPGVSRSGITMTTGLLLGMTREDTARFSFLLSTPIILGAGLIKTPQILANPAMINANFIIGMLVAAVVGLLSIGFLLRYVQTKDFRPFAWYRFALGALVILLVMVRI